MTDSSPIVVDPEDERTMEQFMSHLPGQRRTLADIIQEKLTEKRTEIESQLSGICCRDMLMHYKILSGQIHQWQVYSVISLIVTSDIFEILQMEGTYRSWISEWWRCTGMLG